jgi:hypothetical protein
MKYTFGQYVTFSNNVVTVQGYITAIKKSGDGWYYQIGTLGYWIPEKNIKDYCD